MQGWNWGRQIFQSETWKRELILSSSFFWGGGGWVAGCYASVRHRRPPRQDYALAPRRQYKFTLPRFGLKYLAAPIPALQNLFSTVPFRAQIAQIPNSPPTLESPLVSSLSPPFPTSVPDDDDEDDGRASPPHRSYLIYALVRRTGWSTDNVGRRNRRASQTPSSTASGALHQRRLLAHRGYFTEHIVAPPPPEAVGASPTVSSTAS